MARAWRFYCRGEQLNPFKFRGGASCRSNIPTGCDVHCRRSCGCGDHSCDEMEVTYGFISCVNMIYVSKAVLGVDHWVFVRNMTCAFFVSKFIVEEEACACGCTAKPHNDSESKYS